MKHRVIPDAAAAVDARAAALGVTNSEYIEALVLQDRIGPDGRPAWWTRPVPRDQKELPLRSA
jgi:hypothetical protein